MRRLLTAALLALGIHAVLLAARAPRPFEAESPISPPPPPLAVTLEPLTHTGSSSPGPEGPPEEAFERLPEEPPPDSTPPPDEPNGKVPTPSPDPVKDEPEEPAGETPEPASRKKTGKDTWPDQDPAPEEPPPEDPRRPDEPLQQGRVSEELEEEAAERPAPLAVRDTLDTPSNSPPPEQPPPPGPELEEAVPRYQENPPPAYPRLARRRGCEGTVVLEVLVTREGRVGEVGVTESSGYDILDKAAMDAVGEWRFEPGRRGDRAVDMRVRIPVTFRLQ